MAILHRAKLTPSKLDLISDWIGTQRWYAGKGDTPRLVQVGAFRIDDPDGDVGIETLLVQDSAGREPVCYQVPLTYRAAPLPEAEHAFIGTLEHSVLGTRYVYDGCHDPVYATQLLRMIVQGGTQAALEVAPDAEHPNSEVRQPTVTTVGSGDSTASMPVITSSRVLLGEQSNTSMIYSTGQTPGWSTPLIVKVFRVLQHGANPDVVLQSALTRVGSARVPATTGSLHGAWPDDSRPSGHAEGHLAFAQEFLPGVQDAWREALSAARSRRDFATSAHSLGTATAQLHADLAQALGTSTPTTSDVTAIVDDARRRFDLATSVDPTLESCRARFEDLCARAAASRLPDLQRIHGDFHLGQVLDVPQRGWVMIDFEGEPLRPLADRSTLEPPLRDLAGMLRSFDYAAGSIEHSGEGERHEWATAAREAFLAGYAEQSTLDLAEHRDLLELFEVDKAGYELVYEARNRPDWLPIPRAAIGRLLAEHSPADDRVADAATLDQHEADALLGGAHADPHSVLGGHVTSTGVLIRVFRPLAASVEVRLPDDSRHPLSHEYEGIWTGHLEGEQVPDYRVITTYEDGFGHTTDDPYRFLPTLGEVDLHLIGEGRHEQLWTVLGAHRHTYDSPQGAVDGTSFAVWAPHARGVRVVGDFNHWDGQGHPMRRIGNGGVWELFVPEVPVGTRYKFEILCSDHIWRTKADPMARQSETAPATASIVTDTEYTWCDDAWMDRRASTDPHQRPMSVYEVHLGSWRQGESYRDLADHLVGYVKDLGFTHVELMPVMEHPYPPSWGYHVTGYYAPNSRLGSPDDFRYLVDTLHRNDIGVILDWVPGHFATDEWALARFDGSPCYEHPDRRRGWHPEWGSYIFDFGRNEVRNFLVANAIYWLQEFHADGLRVDGVASMLYLDYSRNEGEWLPNSHGGRENLEAVRLLQETNATAYRRCPGTVMIAEESTSWPGVTQPTSSDGLGFGFKWNMGWMHDSLDYVANAPIYRQYHHNQVTFALVYAWSEQFVLPISHDEVVHGKGSLLRKMPGDRWQQLANLRAFLANMWSHPGKQLIFMGTEFAQESEWADGRSLDWWLLEAPAHQGIHALVRDLNQLYSEHPALWSMDHDPSGFRWIDANDAGGNTFSYIRIGSEDDMVVAVVNYSGSEHVKRVGLPRGGRWREVLNTDASGYGGSGSGNLGGVDAEETPSTGQPYSASMVLPALSAVWLVPEPDTEPSEEDHA
ncbi:1,4-alpha-glucan branching protein GlgB [Leekyejoonella antrihumi]|uniref:1,4-alpha-glucan branching enzyme GlgB n=1 Tax=Leekyejoonella antrihumi TaxID=1660198 RepID=A0A563E2W8_9MICO|nr:1,4-alpha-glucan branching protein GlgB [Leekyejoonella antrihumi]TWP36542.1 1,4-alpha-glucan branching protein GlgB [Leekyejoonella antrihumi]